jgi:hypothetical protein
MMKRIAKVIMRCDEDDEFSGENIDEKLKGSECQCFNPAQRNNYFRLCQILKTEIQDMILES